MLNIWVADELGQIKSCSVESRTEEGKPTVSETELVSSSEGHDRSDYVQIMAHAKWKTPEKTMTGVAIARRGGSIQVLDPITGDILWNGRDERIEGDDMFVALEERNGYLFWCTNHGYYGFASLASSGNTGASSDLETPRAIGGWKDYKLAGPISKARCHPRFPGIFAIGGKDTNLEIWRPTNLEKLDQLSKFIPMWKAKNVKNDEYNLKQPVWISDLQFLDEDKRPIALGLKVVVCTRFHQIRIYDTILSRRPVLNVEYGSSPLVAMVLGANDSEVIFSDSHGKVTSYSLEKKADNGKFAGPTGSVLALDIIKPAGKPGILACVGLDRFLRLFDISNRKSVGNIYCKSKMTSVLVIEGSLSPPDTGLSVKRKLGEELEEDDTDEDEDEEDSVWKKIPEVTNVGALKRRRIRPQESLPTTSS